MRKMMKKIVITLAAAMIVSSVSFASPLTDYDQGSVAIDLNMSISPKVKADGESLDAKNRFGAAVTYGLSDKWAVQYKYADNKSKNYTFEYIEPDDYEKATLNARLSANEFNVLYQLDPNIAAYVGWVRATTKINGSYIAGPGADNITESGSDTEKQSKNGYQVGIITKIRLGDNLNGWAAVGAGNKITSYEIGLGYDLSKNAEWNVFYRNVKYKDFNIDGKMDIKTTGIGTGVTFKF